MPKKAAGAFSFFLAGQGFLHLGESIRFIAVTMLIYSFTGSGITAATGVAMSALPGILVSPFAGVLGDRINESRVLILTDFARFLAIPLLLHADHIAHIYVILVIISVLDVLYDPSRRKFVLRITGKKSALKANSRLSGMSGAAYLAGPLIAGVLTDSYGPAPAIVIGSICCFISCVMTLLSVAVSGAYCRSSVSGTAKSGFSEFKSALKYCGAVSIVRELLAAGAVIGFCTISVNMSFYPYAFDVLKVTARGWSLMITVYYGTSLSAMALVKYICTCYGKCRRTFFYACLGIAAVAWSLYAIVRNFPAVLALQFAEGTAVAACGIIHAAALQVAADKEFMARVACINDILTNAGKLAGMGCMALITGRFTFSKAFIFNSIVMLVFILIMGNRRDGSCDWAG